MKRKSGVIVGGGASGALAALAMAKREFSDFDLSIVDEKAELGRGLAYSEAAEDDLLNVPAKNLSADELDANDFVKWLKAHHGGVENFPFWPFVPRRLFGRYLQSKVDPLLVSSLTHVRSRVKGIRKAGPGYKLELESGKEIFADYLILALGYSSEHHPPRPDEFRVTHGRTILILGTGLTALDDWRRVRSDKGLAPDLRNKVTLLSRHGLLPLPHLQNPMKIRLPCLKGLRPLQIFQILRHLQESAPFEWQDVADALRAQASDIWACWSQRERRQFERHLKSYWEVIRHRMPSLLYEELRNDLNDGSLKILKGRWKDGEGASRIVLNQKGSDGSSSVPLFQYAAVFRATGAKPTGGFAERALRIPGLSACPMGYGFLNKSAMNVWTIGPSSKGDFWEATAIAEIRQQAAALAEEIGWDLRQNGEGSAFGRLSVHPRKMDETYFQHLRAALRGAFGLLKISGILMIHAFLPLYFEDLASGLLRDQAALAFRRRRPKKRRRAPQDAADSAWRGKSKAAS